MKPTLSKLKQFVADRLGVPVESVTRDKYFVDDLGALYDYLKTVG